MAAGNGRDDAPADKLAREWLTKRGFTIEPRSTACHECGQRGVTEADVRSLAALIRGIRRETGGKQASAAPDRSPRLTPEERTCLQNISRLKRGVGVNVQAEPHALKLIQKGLLEFYYAKNAAEEGRFEWPCMRLTERGREALSRRAALHGFIES